jgi:hypothetical protein
MEEIGELSDSRTAVKDDEESEREELIDAS